MGLISIVTGANSGIGKETALALAKRGDEVIIICRNEEKAKKAQEDIIQQTNNTNVKIFLADFSIQEDIEKVSESILTQYNKIDVLVNNAGFIAPSYRVLTKDGFEATFAVNHLGYFALTNRLKPILTKGNRVKIINVSSAAHKIATLNFQNLQGEKSYSHINAYAISKLCNILFTRELAKRIEGTYITANCLHPGVVSTGFAKDSTGITRFLMGLAKPFMISAEQGAETSIFLATSPEADNLNGEYLVKKKVKTPTYEARNMEKAKKLWDLSAEMCNLVGKTF
jgi:NAD(P)-dependent dehydrogenase (short-subunit alcohol dehydrogenase family)